jgi:putative transposase
MAVSSTGCGLTDCLFRLYRGKKRQDKQVINKAIYLALGVNMEGHKALLGMWLSENEGAKFWLNVLTEHQKRGVKDILIACVVSTG